MGLFFLTFMVALLGFTFGYPLMSETVMDDYLYGILPATPIAFICMFAYKGGDDE